MQKRPKQLYFRVMEPKPAKDTSLYGPAHWPATEKQIDTILKLRRILREDYKADLQTITREAASEQIRMLSAVIKENRK